jgi:hypothetical protein
VAGMIGGADSIDDMDLLRHGAMPALFGGVRAPSTLGSFLRSFTWGNVLQLGRVNRALLAELARRAPLLPGKDAVAFLDIDSMQKRVYGHAKQGGAFGHTKIQGKSVLATWEVCTKSGAVQLPWLSLTSLTDHTGWSCPLSGAVIVAFRAVADYRPCARARLLPAICNEGR